MSLVEFCGSNCSLDQRRRLLPKMIRFILAITSCHVDSCDRNVIRSHYMAYVNHLLHCWGPWGLRLMVSSSLPSYQVKNSSISKVRDRIS